MTSSFLVRAMSADEATKLTTIRANLALVRKRINGVTFFIVKDKTGKTRAAKFCEKNPSGKGFLFGNADRVIPAEVMKAPKVWMALMHEFVKFGWRKGDVHDVAPNLAMAEEWAMRDAVLNVTRNNVVSKRSPS